MKHIRLLALMAAMLAVLVTSQSAFANRDPYGMMPGPTPTAGPAAMRYGAGGFQPHQQYTDGMNLYQYVRSNPIVHRDPFGLKSDGNCYCGPDITAWLSHEMVAWYNWVSAVNRQIPAWAAADAPWYEPDFIRAKSYRYAFLALAGKQMTYFPTTTFSSQSCPTSPQCKNTVTVSGTCIHVSEVGNLIYGSVARWYRMTWLQTWGGSIAGNRGKRTDADAAGVGIDYDYGDAGGVVGDFLSGLDAARLRELGSDAPAECKPCPESVAAGQNHVNLPAVTPTSNTVPLKITLPKNVK